MRTATFGTEFAPEMTTTGFDGATATEVIGRGRQNVSATATTRRTRGRVTSPAASADPVEHRDDGSLTVHQSTHGGHQLIVPSGTSVHRSADPFTLLVG